MKPTLRISIAASLLLSGLAHGQGEALKPSNESLKLEVERAIDRGIKFMLSQQQEGGHWGEARNPALTGLAVQAILGSPARVGDALTPEVEKALEYIRSCQALDGGIYIKGLGNYNTAISVMALLEAGQKEDVPLIMKARKFLVNQQADFDRRGVVDNAFDGGVGYGSSYSHPDLSNTYHALEALHATKKLAAETEAEDLLDLDWAAAIEFVKKCQQVPENKEDWVSRDKEDEGGFVYFPGKSMSVEEVAEGRTALRSYGSMGYAGLLSFIYAEMDKDDPRVEAVMGWLQKNYTLEENPGMGLEGLFYYYNTMSKALELMEVDTIQMPDGTEVNWREALTKQLFNLQKPDGSWANENGRWWEGDPILVTSYALLCLERIYAGL